MISDDTEHTLMVAQSLLKHPDDADAFARSLAWRLRWWVLGLPAGVGLATARACLKLWLGFSPERSGIWSAGNGPASARRTLATSYTLPNLLTGIEAGMARVVADHVRLDQGRDGIDRDALLDGVNTLDTRSIDAVGRDRAPAHAPIKGPGYPRNPFRRVPAFPGPVVV